MRVFKFVCKAEKCVIDLPMHPRNFIDFCTYCKYLEIEIEEIEK